MTTTPNPPAAAPPPTAKTTPAPTSDTKRPNYVSPLSTRYASAAMRETFADITRFRLWRQLWTSLARAQNSLGLQVTSSQVSALASAPDVDIDLATSYELELRHDVMAHVHALGDQVPEARPIIHLGATSCFVTDNSDVLQMKRALDILIPSVWAVVRNLSSFAVEYAHLPTLAFTHLQPAQPTTVGKRAALWMQDFLYDAYALEEVRTSLKLRGLKGTTGTQASFLSLFDGDHEKVKELEKLIAEDVGFKADKVWPLTGQTYTRKQDFTVSCALAGLGQSAAKMANDVRLLQHMKEVEEPFAANQIGSSAMPYKRNPMRSERMNALSRFLQTLLLNPAETACTQWLERTLDDSANRRLASSEMFLTADAVAQLAMNVSDGLVVYPKVVEKHLLEEMPFMATESILMAATSRGGDRQTLHEAIRKHSIEAGKKVKEEGAKNDMLERIKSDAMFQSVWEELDEICDPSKFTGRAGVQVLEFVNEHVYPALKQRADTLEHLGSGDVRI